MVQNDREVAGYGLDFFLTVTTGRIMLVGNALQLICLEVFESQKPNDPHPNCGRKRLGRERQLMEYESVRGSFEYESGPKL